MENNTTNNGLMSFDLPKDQSSIIKVIGVGGGGSNAVNHMFNQGIRGVNFVVCNTDAQALEASPVPNKIQLGLNLTEGRGAGSIPDVGRNAAVESLEEIKAILSKNTKMVFITAGMGGGTGTGAAPVIAAAAREMGILTVGIVTVPFMFEGRKRKLQADDGLEEIRNNVDTLLIISNEKLREMHGNLSISHAFGKADDVLTVAAKSIAEIITVPGYVNVDFADVRTVMCDSGNAIMGSAYAEGDNRALKAVETAMASPLLADNNIRGARYVLLYITSGTQELLMDEVSEITDYIQEEAGMTADIIWGNGTDESLGDKISVTVIATGFKTNAEQGIVSREPKKVLLEVENKKEDEKPVTEGVPSEEIKNPDTILVFGEREVEIEGKIAEPLSQPMERPVNPTEEKATEYIPLVLDTKIEITKEVNIENELYKPEPKQEEEAPVFTINTEKPVEFCQTDTVPLATSAKTPVDKEMTPEELFKQNERKMRLKEISHKLKNPAGLKELEKEPAYMRRNIRLEDNNSGNDIQVSDLAVTSDNPAGQVLTKQNSFLHGNVD